MPRQLTPAFGLPEPLESVEQDFSQAADFGRVLVGANYFFYSKLMEIKYIPLKDIVWSYMRQEDSNLTLCCGKGTLSTYYLMTVIASGEKKKIELETRESVLAVLERLREADPRIQIGYSEEIAAQFTGGETPNT